MLFVVEAIKFVTLGNVQSGEGECSFVMHAGVMGWRTVNGQACDPFCKFSTF